MFDRATGIGILLEQELLMRLGDEYPAPIGSRTTRHELCYRDVAVRRVFSSAGAGAVTTVTRHETDRRAPTPVAPVTLGRTQNPGEIRCFHHTLHAGVFAV